MEYLEEFICFSNKQRPLFGFDKNNSVRGDLTVRINIAEAIDRQLPNGFQFVLMLWLSITMVVEGFDNQVQGYTAPTIIKAWHISKASFSPVFVGFQFGFMIGVVALGNLGDFVGRRVMVIAGVLLFGVFTVASAYNTDVTGLAITRGLAAVFLGGAIPNALALAIEYAPSTKRATRVGVMYVIYSLGAAAGGFLAAWIVPHFGWQAIYQLGGWVAIILAVVLYFVLPESARFLVVRQRDHAKVVAMFRKLLPEMTIPSDAVFYAPAEKRETASVFTLLKADRKLKTLPLWVASFSSMVGLQFITSWMPTIFADSKIGYSGAVIALGLFQAAGALGNYVTGSVLDRKNGVMRMAIISLIGAPIIFLLSAVVGLPMVLMCLVSMAGFCIVGTQSGLNGLSGVLYPTAMRSTGSGWSYGVGRIGAILGPILGGALIALHLPLSKIFLIVALPPLCVGLALLTLHWLRPNAVLETATSPGEFEADTAFPHELEQTPMA
jgi:MFS transporter, AAHS family, 4-hydroxybenzoate transporter